MGAVLLITLITGTERTDKVIDRDWGKSWHGIKSLAEQCTSVFIDEVFFDHLFFGCTSFNRKTHFKENTVMIRESHIAHLYLHSRIESYWQHAEPSVWILASFVFRWLRFYEIVMITCCITWAQAPNPQTIGKPCQCSSDWYNSGAIDIILYFSTPILK